MRKKRVAIMLSIVMLLSMLPQAMVSANLPNAKYTSADGVIEAGVSGMGTDNFNQHTVSATAIGYYGKGGKNLDSDVFYGHDRNRYGWIALKDSTGIDADDKVMQLKSGDVAVKGFSTFKFTPQQGYRVEFECDVRATALAFTGNIKLGLLSAGDSVIGGIKLTNTNNKYYFEDYSEATDSAEMTLNTWYKLYSTVWYDSAKEKFRTSSIILDKGTGTILQSAPADTTNAQSYFRVANLKVQSTVAGDTTLEFDNASLVVYKESDFAPGIKTSSIAESNSEIISGQKNAWVQFDQPIATVGTAYITTPSNETVECIITKDSTKLNTYNISWDSDLAEEDGYKITFSGFKNSAEKSEDCTIQFNIPEAPKTPVTFLKAELSDGADLINGADSVSVEESFKLYFDSEVATPAAGTDVKLYPASDSESLADIEISLSDDEKSFTVTPKNNLLLSTQYVLDFSGVISSSGGALTSDTTKLSFTTAGRDSIYESEDFENISAGAYTGSIFEAPASSTVVDGAGYEASRCIKLTGDKIYTANAYDFDTSENLWCEYKVKVVDTPDNLLNDYLARIGNTDGANLWACPMQIRLDNMKKLNMSSRNMKRDYYIKPNRWYTVVVRYTESKVYAYLYDENGNMVLMCEQSATAQGKVAFYPVTHIKTGTEILLDDFKVYRTPSVEKLNANSISTSFKNGKDYIRIQFNQPLGIQKESAKDAITLLCDDVKVTADVIYAGGGELCLLPEASLKENTSYTINIGSTNSLSGNSAENQDINFITAKLYDIKITETSLVIQNGNIEAGDKTVYFENSAASSSGVILAAVYSNERPGRLLGIEILTNCHLSSGTGSVTLNFSNSYSNVGFVDFLTYDSLEDFNAMAQIYRIN